METLIPANSLYYNKSMRLPPDIVAKYSQNLCLHHFMAVSAGHRDSMHNVGHYLQRDANDECVVIYCVGGKGWLEIGGTRWDIHPGDLLLCPRETAHSYGADKTSPWAIYWACFTGAEVPCLCDVLHITRTNPVRRIGERQKIISLFSDMIATLEKGYTLQHLLYASGSLKQILNYLSLLDMYTHSESEVERMIESTINYFLENIHCELELEQISSRVGLSRDYFTKIFKHKTGYTPMDYFIRLKMQKAGTLISTTAMKMHEIANMLGYQDMYYFSRIFKKKMGYSPRQYRKLFNE